MDKIAEFIKCKCEACEAFVAAGKAAEDSAGIPRDDDAPYAEAWHRLQTECRNYKALKVKYDKETPL